MASILGEAPAPTDPVSITIPQATADALRFFYNADEIGGTIASTNLVNDHAVAPATITIPKTAVPATGAITLSGTGALPTITAGPAGSALKLAAGNQTINVVLYKAGAPTPFQIPCTPATGESTVINTINVTAAPASTTTVKAKYAKKSHKAKVTATVTAPSARPTGTMTFTLKKGKKVQTKTVAVTNGAAKATFKKLTKKGKYSVTASYAGSVGASTASTKFKVR